MVCTGWLVTNQVDKTLVIRQKWEKITFFWNLTIIFLYIALLNYTQPLQGLIACCQESSQEVWSHRTKKWALYTRQNSKVFKNFWDFWPFLASWGPKPKIFFFNMFIHFRSTQVQHLRAVIRAIFEKKYQMTPKTAKNTIFGSFSVYKFFLQKNFTFFFLILI